MKRSINHVITYILKPLIKKNQGYIRLSKEMSLRSQNLEKENNYINEVIKILENDIKTIT